jgi:hypothetical protein
MTPMKVFARADREMKRRYATIFSQFDTVLGSFRSAAEKACPIACYVTALTRCLDLACHTSRVIENECVIKLNYAIFAPRGIGGWGIPHICGWLTQETPDDLVSYTTVMSTFYEVTKDSLIKDKIPSVLETTMNQELEEVDVALLLSSPRGVYARGVTNPSGSVFAKLKEGMLSKCESHIFKQALEANASKPVKDAIKGLLSNIKIDMQTYLSYLVNVCLKCAYLP